MKLFWGSKLSRVNTTNSTSFSLFPELKVLKHSGEKIAQSLTGIIII